MRMIDPISIIQVKIDKNFDIMPYMHWFDIVAQHKILSYHQYREQLTAFTSQLLQKYYLASLLEQGSATLSIGYTKNFKPYIASPSHIAQNVKFNITHNHDYVVMAIYKGIGYDIGIDIEQINETINPCELGSVVFSEHERNLVGNDINHFFKLWTKKEALIKALGTGFATDFYQDTRLSLEDLEITDKYYIYTQQIDNYYISICLYKS